MGLEMETEHTTQNLEGHLENCERQVKGFKQKHLLEQTCILKRSNCSVENALEKNRDHSR